jgi:lipopolysaccharide biosynthesis protein
MDYVCNIPSLDGLFVNIPINQQPRHPNHKQRPLKDVVDSITSKVPSTKFYNFDNTGRDPGGYCRLTKSTKDIINPKDIVFCLHTKSCNLNPLGDSWRENLLYPILGTKAIAKKTISLFEQEGADLVGSKLERRNVYGPQNKKKYEMICDRLKIKEEHRYGNFVAGTIFATRYSILDRLFSVIEESDFSPKDNKSSDGRVPHALERMFATTARSMDKKIVYTKGL